MEKMNLNMQFTNEGLGGILPDYPYSGMWHFPWFSNISKAAPDFENPHHFLNPELQVNYVLTIPAFYVIPNKIIYVLQIIGNTTNLSFLKKIKLNKID